MSVWRSGYPVSDAARLLNMDAAGTALTSLRRAFIIAFYFPQFHRIPQNDAWWGEGFTDWVNVRKAEPLFAGHRQPRTPLDARFYDLSQLDVIRWQVDLARQYGIGGFCHYHYWFDGVQLLEGPTNQFLEHRELDLPFCLAWANSTWSRRWDGDLASKSILIRQTHEPDPARWNMHFDYLIRAWSDPRAITIGGKPVFLIYYPHTIDQVGDMLDLWRNRAVLAGLPGLHVVAMQQFEYLDKKFLDHFDAVALFQPQMSWLAPERRSLMAKLNPARYALSLHPRLVQWLRKAKRLMGDRPRFYDFDELWLNTLRSTSDTTLPVYPGAFLDWDNTARYGRRARVVRGSTPERFEFWFEQLVAKTEQRPLEERLIFLNAWNEWAEGTYLEPDDEFGHRYLEAVARCVHRPGEAA
jgi:lipopolysaccharide biosynthesis protein